MGGGAAIIFLTAVRNSSVGKVKRGPLPPWEARPPFLPASHVAQVLPGHVRLGLNVVEQDIAAGHLCGLAWAPLLLVTRFEQRCRTCPPQTSLASRQRHSLHSPGPQLRRHSSGCSPVPSLHKQCGWAFAQCADLGSPLHKQQ